MHAERSSDRLRNLLLAGVLAATGCSDGVELTVKGSRQLAKITGVESTIKESELYLLTEVQITNNLGESIGLGAPFFAVRGSDGVEYRGSPLSELLEDGCKGESSLSPSGSTRCRLVFVAPADVETKALVYGNQYETELQTKRCTRCGDSCVYLDNDNKNCGECGSAVPPGATCVDGKSKCEKGKTDCDGRCVDLPSSITDCGECGNALEPGYSCIDGQPVPPECGDDLACGGTCRKIDADNCGACDLACPDGMSCWVGTGCEGFEDSLQQRRCTDICGAWNGAICLGVVVTYGSNDPCKVDTIGCDELPPSTILECGPSQFVRQTCHCVLTF